jgi:putative N6-adenine-specific DNA methylase
VATLFLPCAGGAEALLAAEVQRITGSAGEATRGGVWVDGDWHRAMQLNLESRLAQRVLWPLIDGPYRDEHDLYDLARHVPWVDWITPAQTLRVDVNAGRGKFGSPLRSLNFAALRVKDAVCDALRDATGERPSVDTHRPDLPLALYVGPQHATLYADTSGEALFKRGWRDARGGRVDVKGEAPLKETLAAAMLAAAGWQGRAEDGPLLDPCCGAGTIAIEAAQLACGIAPGAQRRFAFERMLPFRPHLPAWQALKHAAQTRVHAPAVPVFAGDVSFRLTDFATRNAERAGVSHAIEFKTADALQRGRRRDDEPAVRRTHRRQRPGQRHRAPGLRRRWLVGRILQRPGGALEKPLPGLDRVAAQPRHETGVAHAAEGEPARADVERAHRVPAVPLRPRRRFRPAGHTRSLAFEQTAEQAAQVGHAACARAGRQLPVRRELVHHLRQHLRELAEQVVLPHAELRGHARQLVTAERGTQLIGRDRQVLAGRYPRGRHVPQPTALELFDQAAEPAAHTGLPAALAQHRDHRLQQRGIATTAGATETALTLALAERTDHRIE